MTPYSILNLAKSRRIVLYLSGDQKIRYKGDKKNIEKLIPHLKEHKTALIQILKDELVISKNLKDIGETDRMIIDDILEKCRLDSDSKRVFMNRNSFDFTLNGCINYKNENA